MDVEVGVSVWVLYGGTKAEYFTGRSNDFATKLLLDDLLKLKLPHPKRENIEFIARRDGACGCSFFWTRVPVNGILHKQIKFRIRPTPDCAEAHQQLLESLSIVSLTCKEQSVLPVNEKQRKLSPQVNSLPRYANKHWVRQEEKPSSSRSVTGPVNVEEAEELLNDMALAFKSNIRAPKIEPVEPPIHFDTLPFSREDSVASSRPSVPPEVAPQPLSVQGAQISADSGRLPVPAVKRLPSPEPHSRRSMPMSISPPPSAISKSQRPRPVVSIPSARAGTPEFSLLGLVKTQPTTPTIPRKRLHTPDSETDSRPAARPPPNPRDIPTIQKLTRELWNLRRQVTAGVARETAIIRELRELNSAFIPEASTQVGSTEDFATKTRLEMVESELRAERKRREEAEAALNDIERECREPFIVPALFEAFVSISKITSQAMDQAL